MNKYTVMTDHGKDIDFDIVEARSLAEAQIPAEELWRERGYKEVWFHIDKVDES